jgi:hypothetical protein
MKQILVVVFGAVVGVVFGVVLIAFLLQVNVIHSSKIDFAELAGIFKRPEPAQQRPIASVPVLKRAAAKKSIVKTPSPFALPSSEVRAITSQYVYGGSVVVLPAQYQLSAEDEQAYQTFLSKGRFSRIRSIGPSYDGGAASSSSSSGRRFGGSGSRPSAIAQNGSLRAGIRQEAGLGRASLGESGLGGNFSLRKGSLSGGGY